MKAKVTTTVTTYVDLDTFATHHEIDVEDEDGLSEVSPDVLGAVLVGVGRALEKSARAQYPGADRSAKRADIEEEATT